MSRLGLFVPLWFYPSQDRWGDNCCALLKKGESRHTKCGFWGFWASPAQKCATENADFGASGGYFVAYYRVLTALFICDPSNFQAPEAEHRSHSMKRV